MRRIRKDADGGHAKAESMGHAVGVAEARVARRQVSLKKADCAIGYGTAYSS